MGGKGSLWKRHCVPPLHNVLHLLSLIDLVDQVRSVIDQAHGGLTRNPGTAQPVHIGDAEAVETEVRHLDLDEELLPSSRRLEREFHGEFQFGLGQLFEKRLERGRHRNRERPVLAPLRGGEGDLVLGEIDTAHGDSRFAEAAAGVKGDLEGGLHPLGFFRERGLDGDDLPVRKFRLLCGFVLPELQADQGVGIGVTQADGFPDDHRQGLELEYGRVPSHGLPAFLSVGRPPVDVFERVPVGDVPWRVEFPDLEPEGDPLPAVGVAFPGPWIVTVAVEKLGHPSIPVSSKGANGAGAAELLCLHLRPECPGLHCFPGIGGAELGGFVPPLAIAVDELDEPVRRILLSVNRGHNAQCSLCSKLTALRCKYRAISATYHHSKPLAP